MALIEALEDRGIICPKTGDISQDYFDLPIGEESLLSFLSQFYDLEGEFHVGCSLDRRPPSFSFNYALGEHNQEGKWYIVYNRELKLEVFQQKDFFRKQAFQDHHKKGIEVRDLNALAETYNSSHNYEESITVGWSGLAGGKDDPHSGFANVSISTGFRDGRMEQLDLTDLLPGLKVVGGPLYEGSNPLLSKAKDLRISEIAEKYHSRKREIPNQPDEEVLLAIGYTPAQILLGLLQIAKEAMPFQKETALSQALCERVMKEYKLEVI